MHAGRTNSKPPVVTGLTESSSTSSLQTGHHQQHPTHESASEITELTGHLIHTAVIAGYAVEADAVCAKLPGKTHDQALTGAYQLGPPGISLGMPETQAWLLGAESPFPDQPLASEGVTRPAPGLAGRTTTEYFQPFSILGGVADVVSLSFFTERMGACTILYLRCNNRSRFSKGNIWMLKHLLPAIKLDTTNAHSQWLKLMAWNSSTRLGPITQSAQSLEELLIRLSKTERLILNRLRLGETEREVAGAMGRSPHTIHVHVKSIYRKLMVTSRTQLLTLVGPENV